MLVATAAVLSVVARDLDSSLSRSLLDFPGFLQTLWLVGVWGAAVWASALLVVCLARRRPLLALEGVAAAGLAIALAALVAELAGKSAAQSSATSAMSTDRRCSLPRCSR